MPYLGGTKKSKAKQQQLAYEEYVKLISQETFKKQAEKAKPKTSWWNKVISVLRTGETGNAVYRALEGKNPVEEYGKDMVESLRGQGYDKKTYADVLEKLGMPEGKLSSLFPDLYSATGEGWKFKTGGFGDPSLRGAVGLAGDILGDPTTYLGGAGLVKRIGRESLTSDGLKIFDKATKAKQVFIDSLDEKATVEMMSEGLNAIDKTMRKALMSLPDQNFKGITLFGKEIAKRGVVLAPGRYADKLMQHIPVLNKVYSGAIAGVQDVFSLGASLANKSATKLTQSGRVDVDAFQDLVSTSLKTQRAIDDMAMKEAIKAVKIFKSGAKGKNKDELLTMLREAIEKTTEDTGARPEFIDELADMILKSTDDIANLEEASIGKLVKEMYGRKENYLYHMTTEYGKKALRIKNAGQHIPVGFRSVQDNSWKGNTLFKFVGDGDMPPILGSAEHNGLLEFSSKIEADKLVKATQRKVQSLEKRIKLAKTDSLKKRLGVEIRNLTSELESKIRELPEGNFFKDAAGNIYEKERALTISEANEVMKPLMERAGLAGKDFFETNPIAATYFRGAQGAKVIAKNKLYNQVAETFGIQAEFVKTKTRNPLTGKVATKMTGNDFVDPVTGFHYIEHGISEIPKDILLPDIFVEELRKTSKIINSPDGINTLLKGYDSLMNLFKASVYGWYPGSHGKNLIGGLHNNWAFAGLNPLSSKYKLAKKIANGSDGVFKTKGGLTLSYDKLRTMLGNEGLLDSTGAFDMTRFAKKVDPKLFDKIKDAPMGAMQAVENYIRIPLFLHNLDKGLSPHEAALVVYRLQFDYAPEALTKTEREVIRRIMPFYRWTRGNIPLMIEEWISRPGVLGAEFKFFRSLEDENAGELRDLLPSYMGKDMSVTRAGQTLTGFGLPPVEMLKFLRDPARIAESMLPPGIKTLAELRMNYNLFKDMPITKDVSGNFAESYPQYMKDFLQYEETVVTKKDGTSYTIRRVDPVRKYLMFALPTGRMATWIGNLSMDEKQKNEILYFISNISTAEYDRKKQEEYLQSNYDKQLIEILTNAGLFGTIEYPYAGTKERMK